VIALGGFVLLGGALAQNLLGDSDEPVLLLRDSTLEPGTPVRVHIVGAVREPGVYELVAGDRVVDAVTAAGGALPEADLESVNLARHLRDGEQISIPSTGVSTAPVVSAGGLLDLNTATRDQLMALPGIGEAYSQRIVDSRAVDGPFASVDDLRGRNLVPQRTFEMIRSLVTVSAP